MKDVSVDAGSVASARQGNVQSLLARAAPQARAAWDWLPRGRSLPHSVFVVRHRWLTLLLWAHVVGLPIYGIARGYPVSHSLLEASVIAALAAASSVTGLPARARAALTALGLITSSAILVHFSDGLIEAHFHFFVIVLLLALFEDWVPFLIAIAYVVLHHGIVGQISPQLVYNHPDALANPWKWAVIHSAFVAAAAIGAVIAWRSNENARADVAEATARAVKSQEANELKMRFVASASHELRTPLTSIGGFATTLLHRWDDTRDDDKRQMLEIIEAQSGRLQRLIEDLLVLSTVESGVIPVRRASVDVGAAVREIVRELDGDGTIAVAADVGCIARVDERHLRRIVGNLVSNARRHGADPIEIRAASRGAWIELVCADGGEGVRESLVPHLFSTFTHADAYATDEGSGLGLSIVRGLAQANGGDVRYRPNRPKGARFVVRFPRADAEHLD